MPGHRPRWGDLRRHMALAVGSVLVLALLVLALLAPVVAPPGSRGDGYRVPRAGFASEPRPPSRAHPFGTAEGQYDLFHAVVWGTRTAFKVGLGVALVAVVVGTVVGAVAGYRGGLVDALLSGVADLFLAFPFLVAAVSLSAVVASNWQVGGVLTGAVALMAFAWPPYVRLVRSQVQSLRERELVLSAVAVGASPMRVLFRHIVPNLAPAVLVVASLDVANFVMAYSALGFLGLGPVRGQADWGGFLALARNWVPQLARYWWTVAFPGGALFLFALGWNLVGEGLRDLLDPQRRR